MASFQWKQFAGLNTVQRPEELRPEELSVARNIDIDRESRISRKQGYVITALTGSYHSLWSAPDESICLAVKSGILYRVNTDWTVTALRSGVGDNDMQYVYVNGIVYYTNNTVIGYIQNGTSNIFTDPSMSFKVAPFPGSCIEYHMGRLCIAKGPAVFFTDALALNRIDMRNGFKQFPSDVLMVKSVDSGLYVSDQNDTWFMAGDSPNTMKLSAVESATIQGSAVVIDGSDIKTDLKGSVCIFTTKNGVCLGMGDGSVINVSKNKYKLPVASKGAALVRNQDRMRQYAVRLYN